MSVNVLVSGDLVPRYAKLTTTDITTLVAAGDAKMLAHLTITNLTANTPTFTVAVYNGTVRRYLRFQMTLPARASGAVELSLSYPLNLNDAVEVNISADSADVVAAIVPIA